MSLRWGQETDGDIYQSNKHAAEKQVNTKQQEGDNDGAERARKEAAKWTKLGFWIGIGVILLYVLFVVVLGASIGIFGGAWD